MNSRPQVSFGPCHLVVRKATGAVVHQKTLPREPLYRLVVVRPTDKRMIVKWWQNMPGFSELEDAILEGVRSQLVNGMPTECTVPASLLKTHRRLDSQLAAEGIITFLPANAAEAGVAQVRTVDSIIDELIWWLRHQFAEGPPTVEELNDAGSVVPGWAVLGRIHDQDVRDSWATRICASRGREVGNALNRARRAAFGAAVNQSRKAIAEEDMLDVYERNRERTERYFAPLPSALIDGLRSWQSAAISDRASIEASIVRLLIRDFVLRTQNRLPSARGYQYITPSSTLIGQTWVDRIDEWITRELNAGVVVASFGRAMMCQLDIELTPSEPLTSEHRWVRDLPEKPLLRELLIQHVGTDLVAVSVLPFIENDIPIRMQSIGAQFVRLYDQIIRPASCCNQPLSKMSVLTSLKSKRQTRPQFLRCFVLAMNIPASVSLLQVEFATWIRAANTKLIAWSAGCRIRNAMSRELFAQSRF